MEDAFALDGDESGPCVGRADADADGVSASVGGLVELDLEFRIAFQRPGDVGLARDAVTEPVQFGAGGVAQDQYEIAGVLGGQREVATAGGDPYIACVAHGFFQARSEEHTSE